MFQITRRFEIDYAHRVLNHESRCKYIHGHRGVIEVTVQAPELDSLGRVIDFGVLKAVIGKWLDEHLDHNLIICKEDPIAIAVLKPMHGIADFLQGRAPYIMEDNPTAENLAIEIFHKCEDLLASPLTVQKVRFRETPNSWADYTGDLP